MPAHISANSEGFTYDEWRSMGYQVQAGECSMSRNQYGRAVFTPSQVRPRHTRPTTQGETRSVPRERRRRERPQQTDTAQHSATWNRIMEVGDARARRATAQGDVDYSFDPININLAQLRVMVDEGLSRARAVDMDSFFTDEIFNSRTEPLVSEERFAANEKVNRMTKEVKGLQKQLMALFERVYVSDEDRRHRGLERLAAAERKINDKEF